jgi:hypothetical protein
MLGIVRKNWRFIFAAVVGLGLGVTANFSVAGDGRALAQSVENRATFPRNFNEYVKYGTYDRGVEKEEAFATTDTIAIAKSGMPLPAGTQLVLGIWSNNQHTGYFVMEKGIDWNPGANNWHFQQFDTAGQVKRTAKAERCQSCHSSQANNDYMFTLDRMRAYLP